MEKEREVRLRRRVEEVVKSRVSLLEQDISRLQREVNESFTRLLEQTDTVSTIPEDDQSVGQMEAEVNAQIDQASAASVRLSADIALLRDSVAELNEQRTQADVLNALIARIANFAPRIVLFVVKGPNALAWAARGIDESGGSIRGLSISLQSDTALRAAVNSQQAFYGSPEEHAENNLVFSRLGNLQPQRLLAAPLKVRGKTAAIIYADSADHGENAINVEAIELLVQTSGLVVELVSLRARVSESAQPAKQPAPQPSAQQPAAQSPAVQPAPQAAQPPAPQPAAAPPAQPVHEPARESVAPQPTPERTSGPLVSAQPAASSEARPQAPSSELRQPAPPPAPAFFRPTEPQVIEQPAPPRAPEPAPAISSGGAGLNDEERAHNEARRFARLLVSEIKLYNEQKVTDGRMNYDIYDRLKEDIDRSRQMYDKRVTPSVAARFDYFYDELVNVLAEGDAAKLGSDYPGPSVAV